MRMCFNRRFDPAVRVPITRVRSNASPAAAKLRHFRGSMIRLVVAALLGAAVLLPLPVSARCGLVANESTVYGYGGGALRCTTLEEIEADLRATSMPFPPGCGNPAN
jgi:hypothetical protein